MTSTRPPSLVDDYEYQCELQRYANTNTGADIRAVTRTPSINSNASTRGEANAKTERTVELAHTNGEHLNWFKVEQGTAHLQQNPQLAAILDSIARDDPCSISDS